MECDWTFSCLPLYVHSRWGVASVGKFSTEHCLPCCGEIFFRYWRNTGSRKWSKSFVVKKAGLWPIHIYFLIFWIKYPILIYVNNKFCNRNLVPGLF